MKTFIKKFTLTTGLILSLNASGTETPASCQELMAGSFERTTVSSELTDAIAAAVRDSKKVIELKLQSYNYMMSHRTIYGEYLKQVQIKEDIDKRRAEFEIEKKEYFAKSDEVLMTLVKADSEAYRHILWERDEENERLDRKIKKAENDWKKSKPSYYKAVAAWGPYEYQLNNLEKLETSLLASLENLKKMEKLADSSLGEIVKRLTQWTPDLAEENCARINEGLSALVKNVQ